MKIEINLDDKFFEERFKSARNASFSKSLDLLKNEAINIRKNARWRYPSFLLDSKILTHEFAKILQLKTPKLYQIDCSVEDIRFTKNSVIKPMYENSAKGVFIHDRSGLVYLNKNLKFSNESAAKTYARNMINSNIVRKDKWMVEEILEYKDGRVARDIKFYMFYGEIGLILESERLPSLKRCWYDNQFNPIKTGKYDDSLFHGAGDNLVKIAELAKLISLELPVPFVRIDFLQVDDEIYLGEFTPVPGGYAQLNDEWDTKLGELYQGANTRICNDVACGKVFSKYNKLNKDEKSAIEKLKKDKF